MLSAKWISVNYFFMQKIKINFKLCKQIKHYKTADKLIRDYHQWLNMNLSYQHLEREIKNLSVVYNLPQGCFILAYADEKLAGGGGLRKFDDRHGEMKRLFVYPQYRGMGIGKKLCAKLLDQAKKLGYDYVRLDTVGKLKTANQLYDNLGFYEIKPYCPNPDPTARFMEIKII